MKQKSTRELNDLIENVDPDELDSFFSQNKDYISDSDKGFYYFFKDTLYEKGIKLKDVYSFAGLLESYGGQIIRQEKHTKNRDLIIRLCFAGHFTWDETNRALKLYGFSELYSKKKRDICIISALNHRIFDLAEVDDLLVKNGFKPLSKKLT